jgi:hypothetical protein
MDLYFPIRKVVNRTVNAGSFGFYNLECGHTYMNYNGDTASARFCGQCTPTKEKNNLAADEELGPYGYWVYKKAKG